MNIETRSAGSAFSKARYKTIYEDHKKREVRHQEACNYVVHGILTMTGSPDTRLSEFACEILPLITHERIQIVSLGEEVAITQAHLPHVSSMENEGVASESVTLVIPDGFIPFADKHPSEALGNLAYALSVAQAQLSETGANGMAVNEAATWNQMRVVYWALNDDRVSEDEKQALQASQAYLITAYSYKDLQRLDNPPDWSQPPEDPSAN